MGDEDRTGDADRTGDTDFDELVDRLPRFIGDGVDLLRGDLRLGLVLEAENERGNQRSEIALQACTHPMKSQDN